LISLLANKLAIAHDLDEEKLPWEEIVIVMKRLQAPFDHAKLLALPTIDWQHDIKFLVGDAKISASKELLARNSKAFDVMLSGENLKGHFIRDADAEYAIELKEVNPRVFELLINLLENQLTIPLPNDIALLYALANFADQYGFLNVLSCIEKKMLSCLPSVEISEIESLQSLLKIAERVGSDQLFAQIDYHFSLQIGNLHSEAFSDTFVELLIFCMESALDRSRQQLKIMFAKAVDAHRVKTFKACDEYQLIAMLTSLGEHNKEALSFIWDGLSPLFDSDPKFLKRLWERALSMNQTHLLEVISDFCESDLAYHVWIAAWSTPPQYKNTLIEVV
jgi:hypothetical protein